MNDEDIVSLQDEDEWDFEAAEWLQAPDARRAIVAIGFTAADFTTVAEAAQKRNQSVSEFIREAVLDRARK